MSLIEVLIASSVGLLILGLAYFFLQQGGIATRGAGLRMESFQRLQRVAQRLDAMLAGSSPEALASGAGWVSSFPITSFGSTASRVFSTQMSVASLSGTTLRFYTISDSAQQAVGMKPSSDTPALPTQTQITAALAGANTDYNCEDIASFVVELLPKGYHYTLSLSAAGVTGPIQQKVERQGDFRL